MNTVDVNAELARFATPMCRFKDGLLFCGEKNPGRRAKPFEDRHLCEEHIRQIEEIRAKLRRRYALLDDLLVMRDELTRDIKNLRARHTTL